MTTDAYGPPPQKDKTHPLVWIAGGCGLLVFAVVGFVAFLLFVVYGSMRSSAPYQEAMSRAQSDSRVVTALGTPIRAAYLFQGQMNTKNRDGDANFTIPIRGPKGAGILEVKATKRDGNWSYEVMKVTIKNQEIDLLNTSS